MSSSITNIWIEQDKRVIDFESTLPIPDKDLSNVPSILVKKPTDLDVIPPKGGCYWIWTDEPVKHKFHKGKIPDKVIYNSKEGSIIYNGIAKDNIKARLTHHLFSDQNQGWSGISMDIIPSEPVSHAKKAMSISNNKSKVALLLDGTRINTVQLLSELPLSPSERGFIKTPYRSVFYFRNGINVRDEKHIIFDFVVFYITGLESKSYLEYLEKKWREEYNLPPNYVLINQADNKVMEEFINTLDAEKFRRTNGAWNSLMLNDPWSVGYVTTLIELKQFKTKEEWEEFYYEMGEYRNRRLNELPIPTIELLEDEQLIRTDRARVTQLSSELKNINTQNGRTRDQLARKGRILYDNVTSIIPDITLEECIECVRFRVICETWNGIIVRERNTIRTLQEIFPEYSFEKKDGDFDHQYAVDYEMKNDSEIICGLQIKPTSYTFNTPYLNRAKSANLRKNTEYSERFDKPVFDIISKSNGEIQNPQIIEQIKGLIK